MNKYTLILSVALCTFSFTAFAAESVNADKGTPTVNSIPKVETAKEKYLKPVSLEEAIVKMPKANLKEIISAQEMQDRLHAQPSGDKLYLKFDEKNVLVYELLPNDKASLAELLQASPKEHIINAYTNSQNLNKLFWKTVKGKMGDAKAIGGYKTAGAKSPDTKLENGTQICRLWYEWVKSTNQTIKIRRRGFGLPIGIGLPIGGGRHRPHIGIGL